MCNEGLTHWYLKAEEELHLYLQMTKKCLQEVGQSDVQWRLNFPAISPLAAGNRQNELCTHYVELSTGRG